MLLNKRMVILLNKRMVILLNKRMMILLNKRMRIRPPECGGGGATVGATEPHPPRGRSEHPTRKVNLGFEHFAEHCILIQVHLGVLLYLMVNDKYSLHKSPVFRTLLASTC